MRSTTHMRLEDCAAVSSGQVRFYVLTDKGRVSTLGRVVDVAPHLSATFAVHEAIGRTGWCVSDTDSGARVGYSLVESDAITLAAADLALRTDADMHRARERLRQMAVWRARRC